MIFNSIFDLTLFSHVLLSTKLVTTRRHNKMEKHRIGSEDMLVMGEGAAQDVTKSTMKHVEKQIIKQTSKNDNSSLDESGESNGSAVVLNVS